MHGAGFCFARMTQFTCHLLISAVVVQLYFAQDIPCNVTQEPGGTRYSIPKLKGTNCTSSWSDSNESVLAYQEGHLKELVVYKNNTSLLTSKCLSNIIYRRHCDLEGYQDTVNCSTTCIEKTVHQKKGATPRNHWIVLIVSCVVVVVLGYIGYILRGEILPFMMLQNNLQIVGDGRAQRG